MSDRDSCRKRDEGLAFFAKVVAGQSHEVTNVLNIINELAGLQGDLVGARQRGLEVDVDRIREVASKIRDQVARGQTIVRNINHFAHSVDYPVAVFDLKEAIATVLFLAGRAARLAEVELTADLPTDSIVLESSPFCLQQAVFACVDLALVSASEKRRVTLGYRVGEDGAEIRITSSDRFVDNDLVEFKIDLLRRMLAELGGSLVLSPGEGSRDEIVIRVPTHRSVSGAAATEAAPAGGDRTRGSGGSERPIPTDRDGGST